LNQSGFDLRRLQRTGRFRFDPVRGLHEPKDAAKLDEILLSIFAASRRGLNLADLFARLGKKTTFSSG
jgi:hypothetical protein